MAKRFIDTGLFDDEWFMDLSKDAKILWLYLITKCDHAGIIKLNLKLCKVQTGINDLETVRQQLGNRLVTVGEQLFFIPKFVMYQYPGFPDCKFNMAKSAIAILEKYGLIENGSLTVPEQLGDSIGNGNGNGKEGGSGGKKEKVKYSDFVSMEKQEYEKLVAEHGKTNTENFISILNSYKGSKGKTYKDDYLAILSWVIKKTKTDGSYLLIPSFGTPGVKPAEAR